MARLLTQSLARKHSKLLLPPLTHHHQQHRYESDKAQLIEIEIDNNASNSSSETSEININSIRKLEDVIHTIIVRRSAPDWLPFVPGSSYWVPPHRHLLKHHPHRPYDNLVDAITRISSAVSSPINDDQSMSFASDCGWPSSAYFIEGSASTYPVPMEEEVEVRILNDPEQASTSEGGE